jgi:membrane-associated phospholipid phosphatase
MNRSSRQRVAPALVFAIALFLIGVIAPAAEANNSYPSDSNKPNLTTLLEGMNQLWESPASNNFHGTVKNAAVLAHNDELAVWINNHATAAQQLKALQDANYTTYQVASDGLGATLGPIYLQGLKSGALPLTNALLGNITGYVGTDEAKNHYSFPRPYLRSDTSSADSACNVSAYNASPLRSNREGKTYAEDDGNLKIDRLPDEVDNTGKYVATGTSIGAGYSGFCGSGSFPSGHATAAYLGDVTLATLLPELAPAILARASEQGNNRIVLGVHYPLDIVGGRMDGEVGVAARWSDVQYRHDVLVPAREELVKYLEKECGGAVAECIAQQTPYEDNPYNGAAIPGGTAQIVDSEQSALSVYTERLTYSFPKSGTTGLPPSVPTNAANLLITTFPTLTPAQRTEVLAQTEIESGYPLDKSTGEGSWQRLNLAAAMSAKVELAAGGTVHVASAGGAAEVVAAAPTLTVPGGSVLAGEKAPLVGAGFTAGDEYTVVWASDHNEVLGTFTAAEDGSGQANATIPVGTSAGAHAVQVLDSSGDEVLATPLTIDVTTVTYPQSVTTTSPDGKTIATVFVNSAGELGYTVAQDGETVVKPSRLGLVVGGTDWGKGVTLGTASPTEEDTTYPLIGTHSTAINDFKGNVIPVEKGGASKLGVEIRVFDTGIAFRYDLNSSLAGQTVSGEDTTYAFDPGSEIAYQPYSSGSVDDLQGDTSQEVLSALGTQKILELPTLTSPDGSEYTNIAEANVRDWPALSLETTGAGSITGYYWATDNNAGTFNVSANTLHSPFRVLTVADNLTSLVDSDIIGDVNAPLNEAVFPGGDTSWIKPGVSAWESLNASVGQGQSVSVISNMIKNASEAGMPEVLVEGQMVDSSWGSTTVAKYQHLKELVEQGAHEPNPVKVWLWSDYNNAAGVEAEWERTVNYSSGSSYAKNNLQNPDLREAWMNLVKSTGVVGIKIDHIGNETETKVDLYADVDKAAAERHLMVEFHNPLEPTGLDRTYPNEVGREAIRGVEINYAADQDTDLPFTRYVDGTADYTPLLFSNSSKQNNATWAHEVASTVLYTNPYLQISENPANLKPGGLYHSLLGSLVEHVPTTWKNTTVLPQSELGGRLAGVVRETASGEYWIAVVATPGPAIATSIPLSFLPEGKTYNADVYADKKAASSMSRTTTTVERGTTLKPILQSGGGYLVRITEEEIENPGGGEGEGTTYEITDEVELAEIREHPAATFLIKANITMTHPWAPVQLFSGTIDGNGHTISGLNVEGEASKAFVIDNQGTIQELGFLSPKSVVLVADPTSTNSYTQTTRVGIVAVTNDGLIESVYTKGADVEGGWRVAPIAAENNGEIRNVYTVNSKVVGNWEVGGTVGWNSASGSEEDSYVAAADVTSAVSNGGIFTGYGYSGTKIFGDVVYSGALKVPTSGQLGRVLARENGAPTYENDLSLNTATINGATASGGAANNKNGQDSTEAQLQQQSTYEGIGWNFDTKWVWDPTHRRPVLNTVPEVPGGEGPIESETHEEGGTYNVATEADLALLREHPAGTFNFTADIAMAHPWTPIPSFKGTIDGGGHTITGLEVEGSTSKALINVNSGTITRLGLVAPKSILSGVYVEANRVAALVVINTGTIEQVYTKGADVEGGWRTAPIAAMNEGTIADSYTVDSTVVSNWESGGLVAWNSPGSVVKDDYVAGSQVNTIASNGGILSGYGFVAEGGKAATLFEGDVVYSGALTIPGGKPQGRINGQEKNGTPTYVDDLALDTSTISGAVVAGGAANNKNGKDTTEAELQQQSTYRDIGWDFGVWAWSTALKRPVLRGAPEEGAGQTEPSEPTTISVTKSSASFTASATTPISSAAVIAAVGATVNNGGTLSADVSAVDSDAVGSYPVTLTATDPFDSTVTPVHVTVNVSAAATQTSLAASGSSQTVGTLTPITLTATVAGGDGAPAGTVELDDGSAKLAAAPLEGGVAAFVLPATLAAGDHRLTAHFISAGLANIDSGSSAVTVTVTPATTNPPSSSSNSGNSSNPAPPVNSGSPSKPSKHIKAASKTSVKISQGKEPELTIKVSPATKADGQMRVYVDSHVVKTLALKNGTAHLALPLKQGTHKVKAVYLGDASLKGSTSATIKLTIRH